MSPKFKIIGFGSRGHVQESRNREIEGSWGFPKVKSESYQSKMKQNISTELLGHSFCKKSVKIAPQTPRPQIRISQVFPDFLEEFGFFRPNSNEGVGKRSSLVSSKRMVRCRGGSRYVEG